MTSRLLPIDPIRAVAVDAGIGEALVDVELAVLAFSSGQTATAIAGQKLLTVASILAWAVSAVTDWPVAKAARPARLTLALERADVVDAAAVLARVVLAVIDVDLAPPAGEADGASALVVVEVVGADAPVEARARATLIQIRLTVGAVET